MTTASVKHRIGKKARQFLPDNEIPSTKLRSRLQKSFFVAFVVIYSFCYLSLSSNPKGSFNLHEEGHDSLTLSFSESNNAVRDAHIREQGKKIARIWKPMNASQWCIDGRLKQEQAKGKPMGLCYVKMPRAASTTLAAINYRISSNFARRQGIPSCIRHDGPTPAYYYRHRMKGLSLLWTFIRDPTDRALSRIADSISKHRDEVHYTGAYSNNVTDSYILNALKSSKDMQFGTISEGRGGFQTQYSMMQVSDEDLFWSAAKPDEVQNHFMLLDSVKTLLTQYDFIGVVERLDESLVVFQLLMGLETSDILYISSRLWSQYSRTGGKCIENIDPQTLRSFDVREYLQSPTWWAQNYGDRVLHQAASYSLDLTIQQIGAEYFREAYIYFQQMKKEVIDTCQPIFPCSKTGIDQWEESKTDCYEYDIGCGYSCMDDIADRALEDDDAVEKHTSHDERDGNPGQHVVKQDASKDKSDSNQGGHVVEHNASEDKSDSNQGGHVVEQNASEDERDSSQGKHVVGQAESEDKSDSNHTEHIVEQNASEVNRDSSPGKHVVEQDESKDKSAGNHTEDVVKQNANKGKRNSNPGKHVVEQDKSKDKSDSHHGEHLVEQNASEHKGDSNGTEHVIQQDAREAKGDSNEGKNGRIDSRGPGKGSEEGVDSGSNGHD